MPTTLRRGVEFHRGRLCSGPVNKSSAVLAHDFGAFSHNNRSLALWWVADYYVGSGDLKAAEINYQLIFENPSWARTQLGYQARMMAGRVAAARLVWKDAADYFLGLYNDTNAPPDMRMQALFAYGDYWISRDSTNKLADYEQAILAFTQVHEAGPTNRLGLLALGQKAICLLQWAADGGTNAAQAFRELAASPYADVVTRSIATIGLGLTLEKRVPGKAPAEQAALLQEALGHYLDVFYYEKSLKPGEKPDLFWVRRAGEDAARLAERTGRTDQAINVYKRLQEMFPPRSATYERRIALVRERLARPR
jgi:tetratricopeptide (TPR) repeat protein